jgi:hypothetical protein
MAGAKSESGGGVGIGPACRVASRSAETFKAIGDVDAYAQSLSLIGHCLRDEGRHTEVLEQFLMWLALTDEMTPSIAALGRPYALIRVGQCLGALGRRREAIATLTEAIDVLGPWPNFRLAKALETLAALMAEDGSTPRAGAPTRGLQGSWKPSVTRTRAAAATSSRPPGAPPWRTAQRNPLKPAEPPASTCSSACSPCTCTCTTAGCGCMVPGRHGSPQPRPMWAPPHAAASTPSPCVTWTVGSACGGCRAEVCLVSRPPARSTERASFHA